MNYFWEAVTDTISELYRIGNCLHFELVPAKSSNLSPRPSLNFVLNSCLYLPSPKIFPAVEPLWFHCLPLLILRSSITEKSFSRCHTDRDLNANQSIACVWGWSHFLLP